MTSRLIKADESYNDSFLEDQRKNLSYLKNDELLSLVTTYVFNSISDDRAKQMLDLVQEEIARREELGNNWNDRLLSSLTSSDCKEYDDMIVNCCPECGRGANLEFFENDDHSFDYFVFCDAYDGFLSDGTRLLDSDGTIADGCHMRTERFKTPEEAVDAWNKGHIFKQ